MKCGICKKEFDEKKTNGTEYKRCLNCREKLRKNAQKYKCPHNRQKNNCKECGGSGICEHNRIRGHCKECGGSQICEHNKYKSFCKECGGSQICEHNKVISTCKDCGGSSICEHNKYKHTCKDCGVSGICEHNRERNTCKDCGGSSICEHNRIRSQCKECKGSQICEHNKQRSKCKDCGGSSICEHNRERYHCIICNPKKACSKCLSVYVASNYKYHPYCFTCFCIENPDVEIPKKYKFKEHYLRDTLKERYDRLNFIFNKKVGVSNRFPDILIKFELYSIIIECDELRHNHYNNEYEREMEIYQDLGSKPLVFIRFNPDSYINNEKRTDGCFTLTKTSGWKINKSEWKRRTDILIKVIDNYINNPPTKFTRIELFY